MKLLKKIHEDTAGKTNSDLSEDAAGGACGGGVGALAMLPLFSTMVQRTSAKVPKPKEIEYSAKKKKKPGIGLSEAYRAMSEDMASGAAGGTAGGDMATGADGANNGTTKFDSAGVISKLKGLENKEKQDHRDTVTFGLEDDDGGIVKVTVRSEQAEDFERSLQACMSDYDEATEKPEIAEILFKLKDGFDIVDVEWPEVAEDEEEDVDLQGGDPSAIGGDPNADPMAGGGDPNAMGGDPNADPMAGGADPLADAGGGDQSKDLLTQVIDMMKADAEARKAEARAKEAEAKAKEADAIVAQAMSRVKQEEQYLDMDTHNKAKKEEDREAKRLAQLAKWKHEMSTEHGVDTGDDDEGQADLLGSMTQQSQQMGQEQEERSTVQRPYASLKQPAKKAEQIRGKVHPHDVARFILNRVK